ncbi:MAG: CoA ester lyase [bacterium]
MLQNADVFGADALIIDLEDAVSAVEKDAARELVKEYLRTWKFGKTEVMVRINGAGTEAFNHDLDAIVCPKIDAIVFPKADVESLYDLDVLLTAVETAKGMTKKIAVIPIVETAIGVVDTDDIAAMPRVTAILLGGEDLATDMEIVRTKTGAEIAYPRAKIAFACKAAGIDAIDTPFTDVKDGEGLAFDTGTARSLGFVGKAVIHPNQIETVHRVFSPAPDQIRWARRVVAAAVIAEKQKKGAFGLDGKMIDKPVIDRARKIIQKAVLCGLIGENDEQ